MPDIDKLQEPAYILEVSANELLSGERITDEKLSRKRRMRTLLNL